MFGSRLPFLSECFLLCLFLLLRIKAPQGAHLPFDSFPPLNEYEFDVLDPYNMFGSPRGGFSRATLSRLATVPFQLPAVPVEDPSGDPLYMQVRDSRGRRFVCRLYHEDELDPQSLEDSLFDSPKLRTLSSTRVSDEAATDRKEGKVDETSSKRTTENKGDGIPTRSSPATSSHLEAASERVQMNADGETSLFKDEILTPLESGSGMASDATGSTRPHKESSGMSEEVRNALEGKNDEAASREKLSEDDVEDRLKVLDGLCAHIHLGWWSTEWCYKLSVNQFHVTVDQSVPEHHRLRITDLTKLGSFERRRIELDLGADKPPNPLAGDLPEVARVLDIHTDGDVCDATGQPRTTLVQILCCSSKLLEKSKQWQPEMTAAGADAPVAALYGVFEDPDKICNYVVTVCTSLLCGDDEQQRLPGVASQKKKEKPQKSNARPKENESVREILDRTIGDRCLDSSTVGWWSYSYCHGEKITQYHEVLEGRKTGSGAHYTTRSIEAEHLLGRYQAELDDAHARDEEWKHVVNATAKSRGGPGSYFQLEYTGGDICDHSDVTDAAIIAGGIGAGLVARSSTVRFFCGSNYMVSVSEDSTCHYLVDVTVPDLCSHPLFKEPIMKKQTIKCLPVVENGQLELETDEPANDSDDIDDSADEVEEA